MTGTTSPYGLPYPTDGDFVLDGASDLQALAEAVDDLVGVVVYERDQGDAATLAATLALETGWAALPDLSGTELYGNTPAFSRDRAGNVHLRGIVQNPGVTISTLPVGFRPGEDHHQAVYTFDTATVEPFVRVGTDGVIHIPADSNITTVSLAGIVFRAES